MALRRLTPSTNKDDIVNVQQTTLSRDVLGRFLCNTLDEAINPQREQQAPFDLTANFDAIVIGSGMYGAYCASRLWRSGAKVLVLEAGPFLISEHYQNLSNVGLGTGGVVDGRPGPNNSAEEVTDQVFGLPWRGNQIFGRQAFCVGGKSLFWGGWSPRLTPDVLDSSLPNGAGWPKETARYLAENYPDIELQMGVKELVVKGPGKAPVPETRTDLFNSPQNALTHTLEPLLKKMVGKIAVKLPGGGTVQTTIDAIEPAPIAIQANAPGSGLFSFDKFSSLPLLVEAVRDDIGRSDNLDQRRRLFIVPNTRVLKLQRDGDRVTALEVWDGEKQRPITIPSTCQVVLALSGIESTRLALESFGDVQPIGTLAGRNLMAHIRNNFTVRIRRGALGLGSTDRLQTSAFHIACRSTNGGRYHYQFYAGFQPGASAEAVLYRMIPDINSVKQLLANQDPEWVAITFRGCGEMFGRTGTATGNSGASYINLSQDFDEFGKRRAFVHYEQQGEDLQVFDEMDQAMFSLAFGLAKKDPDNIEYFDQKKGEFVKDNPFAEGQPRYGLLADYGQPIDQVGVRDALGTTYHDSGTLWMGDDKDSSVTDPTGRFHKVKNVFCVDQAVFPRVGSANPVPTGLLIARLGAEVIAYDGLKVVVRRDTQGNVIESFHEAESGFTPLLKFKPDAFLPMGWIHTGRGGFARFDLVLESAGGIGMLYYSNQEYTDFTLRLQWRACTVRNNAGVYVRVPRGNINKFDRLVKSGYEIQIDNTGERPGDQPGFPFSTEPFNSYHQTGAIYPVHPIDNFPSPGDLPNPNGAQSITPIPTRALETWNDMEVLVAGNRIKVLLNGVPVLRDNGGVYTDSREAYKAGLIALQNHFKGFRVQFRHVRIKEGAPAI